MLGFCTSFKSTWILGGITDVVLFQMVGFFCFLILSPEVPVPPLYRPLPAKFAGGPARLGSSSPGACSDVRVVDGRVGKLSAAICNVPRSWMQACTDSGLIRRELSLDISNRCPVEFAPSLAGDSIIGLTSAMAIEKLERKPH